MLVLNQCPKDYVMNNLSNQGIYSHPASGNLMVGNANITSYTPTAGGGTNQNDPTGTGSAITDLVYPPSAGDY